MTWLNDLSQLRRAVCKGKVWVAAAIVWFPTIPASSAEEAAHATKMFNGVDLTGWEGSPGWWKVEDGAITSESTSAKPCKTPTYLIWKGGKPADFELTCDFRLSAGANSGIQIRSEARPDWDTFGYQADMTGDGSLVGFVYHHALGLIAGRGQRVALNADGAKEVEQSAMPEELLKHFRKNDWNQYRVICRGPEITLFLNGVWMCGFTDNTPGNAAKSGIIALQMHPGPPMKVQFRNLVLKELRQGGGRTQSLTKP